MDEQTRREEARKRAVQLRGFYQHLAAYVVVNAVLLAINLVTSPGRYWFFWPLFGWGIGVAFHALSVFGGLWGKTWEKRKIKELMDRDGQG